MTLVSLFHSDINFHWRKLHCQLKRLKWNIFLNKIQQYTLYIQVYIFENVSAMCGRSTVFAGTPVLSISKVIAKVNWYSVEVGVKALNYIFLTPLFFLHTQRYTYVCLCHIIHYTLYIHVYIGVKFVTGFVHLKYHTYVYAAW